jgi:cytochrome b6
VTVQRFFALHVAVLPMLFAGVLMLHLWLVQMHGNAVPPSEALKPEHERRSIPFFPNFLARDLAMWLLALNVVAILATLYPWQLGPPADSLAPAPEGIHPEWYFMSQFHLLKVLGRWFPGLTGEVIGMALFGAVGLGWALIPLYDPDTKNGRRARNATWFGLALLVASIVITIWAYLDL